MKMLECIKKNRNIIGLMGSCLVNNVLYMFLNTFMVAYFITLTHYDYRLISIYYILSFVGIFLIFILLGRTVKNKNQVGIFRIGIVLYCIYILVIALLKEKIVIYYAYLGFFYGIVQGLFWVAGHVLINEYTKNIENKFISIKSMLSRILKIFFPIIFGASIELTSFSYIAKIVILLSIIQFSFSLLIKDEEKINPRKYDLKEYIRHIRNDKNFIKLYKINACDVIVNYLLETLITILIVITFKTALSLGVLTTIFSICSILSVYIFQYKIKNSRAYIKISGLSMIVSLLLLLVNINKITIIIYNLCNSVFLVLLRNECETKSYDIVNKDEKVINNYIVEHQVILQLVLNISRIIGYTVLFIVSLFNDINLFKLLLLTVTLIIFIYSKYISDLSSNE